MVNDLDIGISKKDPLKTKLIGIIKKRYVIVIFMLAFGFLIGIGTGYEEPTCPEPIICPETPLCVVPNCNCVNTTIYNETIKYIERCTIKDCRVTEYIQQLKQKERQLEECYNLTETIDLHNTSNRLIHCEADLEEIKKVLE